MKVDHFTFVHRSGVYSTAIVYAGKHRIEITESPTGRSVIVYVNRAKVDLQRRAGTVERIDR